MRALIRASNKKFDIRLSEYPKPDLTDNCSLIRIKYAGICGHDAFSYQNDIEDDQIIPPIIIGHEGSGFIEAIQGDSCNLSTGQPVVFETTFSTCNTCEYCKRGEINLCKQRQGIGSKANGCFADYIIVPTKYLHPIPSGIDIKTATLAEPLACSVHAAIETARINKNEKIVIFGPGTMGILIAILAKYLGAEVFVFGTTHSNYRLSFLKNHGIAHTIVTEKTIESSNNDFFDFADAAFECSGNPSAFQNCLAFTKPKGRVIQVSDFLYPINIDIQKYVLSKEITISGSKSSISSSWEKAMKVFPDIYSYLEPVITNIYNFSDWANAYKNVLNRSGIKTLMQMS